MLIQGIASGVNALIKRCTGYDIPNICERPIYAVTTPLGNVGQSVSYMWVTPVSRGTRIVAYHTVCDAVEGAAVGFMFPFALEHINPNIESYDTGGAIMMVKVVCASVVGAALGAVVGTVRGARIAAGTHYYPHYYDLLVGGISGGAIAAYASEDLEMCVFGAAVGTVVGAAVISMRLTANAVHRWFFPVQ